MRRTLFEYHPVIGHLAAPDLKLRAPFVDGPFKYRTNSTGFRSATEFTREKPAGVTRALLFGDSFTEGGGVSEGHRYSELLEERIPNLEIYNFGTSGTGTDQQYLTYGEFASNYEHDLVVIGVWVENIRRNVSRSRYWRVNGDDEMFLVPKPYFTLADSGALELHNQPVPQPIAADAAASEDLQHVDRGTVSRSGLAGWMRGRINALGPAPKRLAQRLSRWQPLPEYNRADNPGWQLTRAILEQWASESSVPVLIVPIPLYQHVERTAPAGAIRARFAELHAPPQMQVHDALPDLWAYSAEERREFRFAHDHHLSYSGHEALARSLAPTLERLIARVATPQLAPTETTPIPAAVTR